MEVLVVGAGDVGRWMAGVIDDPVAFADVDPATAEAAADAVADARSVPLDTEASFLVVCIAVPLPAAVEAIRAHAANAEAAIVDVTGVMAAPLAVMSETSPDLERASFHPLFAPKAAPGTVATAVAREGPHVRSIRDALRAAGNEVVDVDPDTHDEAMRTVQGRAHAAILAFALASREADIPAALETPVYRELRELAERVTGGTPRVYADIQATFGGAGDVAAAAERLNAADTEEFVELYRAADTGGDDGS